MIFLGDFIKINENKFRVTLIHNNPLDLEYGMKKSVEELNNIGMLIEDNLMIHPNIVVNKNPILYLNPSTKELWYEYEDIPPSPKTELELLYEKVAQQEQAILELSMLVGGGA